MADFEIVDSTVEPDDIDISHWQKYGKDRLYVNKAGKSHDNCYVDLDGDEGHSTWGKASFDVDGDIVTIQWKSGWSGNWSEHEVVVDLDPSSDGPNSEVPPEVPQNSRTQGIAQQINAREVAGDDR